MLLTASGGGEGGGGAAPPSGGSCLGPAVPNLPFFPQSGSEAAYFLSRDSIELALAILGM